MYNSIEIIIKGIYKANKLNYLEYLFQLRSA